jgi:hypothetical protein
MRWQGTSLALSPPDGNTTLAVGAPLESRRSDGGRSLVFRRANGVWLSDAAVKLVGSDVNGGHGTGSVWLYQERKHAGRQLAGR